MLKIIKKFKHRFYINTSFYIFKIDNFLSEELHRCLYENFNQTSSKEIENLSINNK